MVFVVLSVFVVDVVIVVLIARRSDAQTGRGERGWHNENGREKKH